MSDVTDELNDEHERGLYAKFTVETVDPAKQAKHRDCRYFVLDLTHDPIARVAAQEYALNARLRGFRELADDLDRLVYGELARERFKLEEPKPGPHSRACGIRKHDHGPECHTNCPTCGGKNHA